MRRAGWLALTLNLTCGPKPPPEAPAAGAEAQVPVPVEEKAPADEPEGELPPEAPPLTPQQIEARNQLADGRRAAARGDATAAMTAFRAAATAEPTLPQPAYNLGLLAERQGDDATARQQYEAALAIDPEFEPAVTALSLMRLRAGSKEEALARGRVLSLDEGLEIVEPLLDDLAEARALAPHGGVRGGACGRLDGGRQPVCAS